MNIPNLPGDGTGADTGLGTGTGEGTGTGAGTGEGTGNGDGLEVPPLIEFLIGILKIIKIYHLSKFFQF